MAALTDKAGRPYAKLSELKASDLVQVDGDFGCVAPWEERFVERDRDRKGGAGLYIRCKDGRHYLEDQADDGDTLIGVYRAGA